MTEIDRMLHTSTDCTAVEGTTFHNSKRAIPFCAVGITRGSRMGFSSAKTMFAGISTAGAWELMARAMSAERGAAPTLMAATPLMRRLSANDMSGAISLLLRCGAARGLPLCQFLRRRATKPASSHSGWGHYCAQSLF